MKHELQKDFPVIPIVNYKGVNVMRVGLGYNVFDQYCHTPEDVDKLILEAGEAINKSLTISNTNGSINTIDND